MELPRFCPWNNRSSARSVVTLAVTLAASVATILAAPPPNDNCSSAMVIPGTGFPRLTAAVDISDATKVGEPPMPTCEFFSPTASRSVWYRFTPALDDVYRISTCPESGAGTTVPDTILAVYAGPSGCGGPLTQIPDGCADDTCNLQSEIIARLNATETYYIVVWQFDDSPPASGQGFVQLLVDRAAPVNDVCASATQVHLNIPAFGSTVFAAN